MLPGLVLEPCCIKGLVPLHISASPSQLAMRKLQPMSGN
uniref:Uncharacterized protein n=1 Tax=Arundo donax TaxID=35708 RepID=A0A0A9BKN2_ARUDO